MADPMNNNGVSPKSAASELVKHFFLYSFGMAGGIFFVFLQGVALRKILDPSSYGNFHFFTVLITYLAYLNFGIVQAAEREIPLLLGKGESAKLEKIQNISFSSTFFLAFAAALIGYIASPFLKPFLSAGVIQGLMIILAVFVFQQIINFYETLTRCHRNFSLIGKRIFLTAFLNALFTLSLGYFFGLFGSLFGLLIAAFIMACFYWMTYRGRIKIEFDRAIFFELLKVGLPIFFTGLLYTLLVSIDSIFVYVFWGSAMAGVYSLAFLLFTIANLAPRVLGIIVYPRFLYQYSQEGENGPLLYSRVKKTLKVTVIITSLLAGGLFFLVDPLVRIFLPGYSGGLAAAKIILAASLFLSVIPIQGYFLIAKKQLKRYVFANAFSLAAVCLAVFWIIRSQTDLRYVAFAAGLGYFINASLLYLIIDSQFVKSFKNNFLNLLKFYFPFAYFFFSLFFCSLATAWISDETAKSILAVFLFLLVCSPLLVRLHKEFNLFNEIIKYLKSSR